MNECYLKNCSYHFKDEPFCTMDTCLMSDTQFRRLKLEKQEVDLAQLYRESCEELYDDSDK